VADLEGSTYTQRFYRARPAAVPVFSVAPVQHGSSGPYATPKANDARNRVAVAPRDAIHSSPSDRGDSPPSKTWTSRERIKAATCVSLSRDGRFLAVGETGYSPRVLIFTLKDGASSDQPLVSINEHAFGVRAVAWSPDGRFLASLGDPNDGFLFIWKIDPRTGSARLFQQNRCTAQVNGMIWLGSTLISFGTRHVKAWKVVDEGQRPPSPAKRSLTPQEAQKTLTGRNVLLGSLLEATFTCAVPFDEAHALVCSDAGDVCILDDSSGQIKLTRAAETGFPVTCCTIRGSVALLGGKDGQYVTLDVSALDTEATLTPGPKFAKGESGLSGFAVMGVVQDQLVTIDLARSIEIWDAGQLPNTPGQHSTPLRLAGQSDPVLGVQPLTASDDMDVAFFTWSKSGKVLLWDLDGIVKHSFDIPVGDCHLGNEADPQNQLCVVRADANGHIFASGDKAGVFRVIDRSTGQQLLETKAHSSEITHVAFQSSASRTIIATCGRDRTVQLFHGLSDGSFDLLQTLEFPARVSHLILSSDDRVITCSMDRNIQVYELVTKEGDADSLAAIYSRSISLKASPVSMVLDSDCKSIFVSSSDRSICRFDIESGRQTNTFKCTDENGTENAVVDSLNFGPPKRDEIPTLIGISNTDKSVRVYDSQSGAFKDREWGHTESINGVTLVDSGEATRKVVSVGCDGTIMIWTLDLRDPEARAGSRSPSPVSGSTRPVLRRVLSKAELAEYPRPSSSGGRRSPPTRTLRQRKSRQNISSSVKTPTTTQFPNASPTRSRTCDYPSRRPSSSKSGGPGSPESPATSCLSRRPSLPALGATPSHPTARKKSSAISLRSTYGAGSMQAATEQTCRQLRTYRKKLSTAEPISSGAIAELENELRLTTAALCERISRDSQAASASLLSGLLDQYSERLVSMLDERLRVRLLEAQLNGSFGGRSGETSPTLLTPSTTFGVERVRPRTAGEGTRKTSN
jgi:WD40 repeat protein